MASNKEIIPVIIKCMNVWNRMKRIATMNVFKQLSLHKKPLYIHQLTTMLSTSKNVLFPGHNHLLTTGADDLTL